jgi:hypothetical protein
VWESDWWIFWLSGGVGKTFNFSGWVSGPLYSSGELLEVYLAIWGAGMDFIFSQWVSDPLCRWMRVIGGISCHLGVWEGQ